MTNSDDRRRQDDSARYQTTHNPSWIQVQRRHGPTTGMNHSWQSPPPQDTSTSAAAQQPIDPRDIVAFVQQHGRNEPWDGLAYVSTQTPTTADWYNAQQYDYQQQSHQYHPPQYPQHPQHHYYGYGDVAYQQTQGDGNGTHGGGGQHVPSASSSTRAQDGSYEVGRERRRTSPRRDERHRARHESHGHPSGNSYR